MAHAIINHPVNPDDRIETAMCLWEAFLEAEHDQSPPPHPYPNLRKMREDYGTWTVRHEIITACDKCDEAWLALSEDERDSLSFDWEFCPDWLEEYDKTLGATQ